MQISVEEMLAPEASSKPQDKKKSYFTLSNDGDSAIVRFLHTDINDFDVLDVHSIQLGGYTRKINCLKPVNGTKDDCALCQANIYDEDKGSYTYPLQRRFFIHLINYSSPTNGEIQVWERSKDYIKKLNQLVEDYGPLYNRLYKIVRHGAAKSTDTTYDILPLDKDRFNPDDYTFNSNDLNYKKALGSIVLNQSNEAIREYLETGNFPNFNKKEVTQRPQPTQLTTTVTYEQTPQQNSINQEQIQPQPQVQPNNQMFGQSDEFPFDMPRRRV